MNSFIFKFFNSLKTFAWRILHGRVKARPSGQNAPITGGGIDKVWGWDILVVWGCGGRRRDSGMNRHGV